MCGHRLALALHHERGQPLGLEQRPRTIEHGVRREHLSGSRLRHQPRGEVDGVAHRQEGRPVLGADLAGEDRTTVDPRAQCEADVEPDDLAEREEHELLVVAGAAGRAEAQVELAAIGAEVGRLQADVAIVDRRLHAHRQRMQSLGGLARAVLGDHAVEPAVLEERDGGRAVLGLHDAGAHGVSEAHGDQAVHVVVDREERSRGEPVGVERSTQQDPGRDPSPDVATRQRRGGRGTDEDLATFGRSLELDEGRDRGAADDQLPVRCADEEEVEVAAVHADRHAQVRPADTPGELAELADRAAHLQRRCRRPELMTVATEEQQERIATELQQRAAEGVRLIDQLGEARVDDLVDRLGADLAQLGQPFGELGEARHVGEHHRPLDGAVQRGGGPIVRHPLAHQTRHVHGQIAAVIGGRRHRCPKCRRALETRVGERAGGRRTRKAARPCPSAQIERPEFSQYGVRSSRLSSLPASLRGICSTMS